MPEFININLQEAAITLADELNLTRATIRLQITQSELSRRISELENLLSLQLFRMGPEEVEITEDGQFFVNACRRFLQFRSGLGAENGPDD